MNHLKSIVIGSFNREASRRVVLCSTHWKITSKVGNSNVETIEKLIANDVFVGNLNFMITDDENQLIIFYSRDDTFLYFAVTDCEFGQVEATRLFNELKQVFPSQFSPVSVRNLKKNELQKQADKILKRFAEKYNDPSKDKMVIVQAQVDDTRRAVENNVNRMLERQESLDKIQGQSGLYIYILN